MQKTAMPMKLTLLFEEFFCFHLDITDDEEELIRIEIIREIHFLSQIINEFLKKY